MIAVFTRIVGIAGYAIEVAGVLVITVGFIVASVRLLSASTRHSPDRFEAYRRELGESMLLGLEFLVAGDIIRTVIVDYSIDSIMALGLLVLIRTVLVFTIHLEVHGRWPWRSPKAEN